jgi:hypothetical protein
MVYVLVYGYVRRVGMPRRVDETFNTVHCVSQAEETAKNDDKDPQTAFSAVDYRLHQSTHGLEEVALVFIWDQCAILFYSNSSNDELVRENTIEMVSRMRNIRIRRK